MDRVILIRYGEIFLKGDNRPHFISALARRVRYAIQPLGGRLELAQGRMYVKGVSDMERCIDKVRKVFGVHSVSPAWEVDKNMEAIEKATMVEYGTSKCENELSSVNQEIEVVVGLMQKSLNKPVLSSSGEGSSDFDGLAERYESLKKRHSEIEAEINERKRRQGMLREFFKALSGQPDLITEFDPMMFSVLVDHATVYPEKRIVFTFRDGREV